MKTRFIPLYPENQDENKFMMFLYDDICKGEYAVVLADNDRWDFHMSTFAIDNNTSHSDIEIRKSFDDYIEAHSVRLMRLDALHVLNDGSRDMIFKSIIGEILRCITVDSTIKLIICSDIGTISDCEIYYMINTHINKMKNVKVHYMKNCTIDEADDKCIFANQINSTIGKTN